MQRQEQPSSPWTSRIFVIVFVLILALILAGFLWLVQNAKATLPQENEVISMADAAQRIRTGEVERILLQGDRDVFLYLPDQPRPLYARLDLGTQFTSTIEILGVSAGEIPPLTVESK